MPGLVVFTSAHARRFVEGSVGNASAHAGVPVTRPVGPARRERVDSGSEKTRTSNSGPSCTCRRTPTAETTAAPPMGHSVVNRTVNAHEQVGAFRFGLKVGCPCRVHEATCATGERVGASDCALGSERAFDRGV